MKKFFVVVFLCSGILFSQENQQFKVQYDFAKFRGDDKHLYYELYYSFDVSLLKYVKINGGYQSEALVQVTFKHSAADTISAYQAYRIPFSISDTALVAISRAYSSVHGFLLKPDIYRAYIVVRDYNNPKMKDSISLLINLTDLSKDNIALSDVELCTSIVPMDKDSTNKYYKNTFEVKPNPSRIFGEHQPVLFYYIEAYNLKKSPAEKYFTRAIISNAVGKEVVSHEKSKRIVHNSNVEVGMMKVHTLKTGAYNFTYQIIDSVLGMIHSTSKRFFVYNPSLPVDTLIASGESDVHSSEFAAMTEDELDKLFEQSRYVATTEEIKQYQKLKGLETKRKAVYDFWTSRDVNRNAPVNQTKQEYFRRVVYANNQYKSGQRVGWKTDRGRVYITYGPPDDVERHANEIDVKPYEIWFYHNIQGGVQFVFGDRTGFSDYVLLHSTHRSEIRDDNWKRLIEAQ